jgi:uncharacterized protein YggE
MFTSLFVLIIERLEIYHQNVTICSINDSDISWGDFMKAIRAFALPALLALSTLPALADPQLLTVVGEGTAPAVTSETRITTSIETQAPTPDAVVVAERQALDRVTSALRPLGVIDKDIIVTGHTLTAQNVGNVLASGGVVLQQPRPISGYALTDQITVALANSAQTDKVLAALVTAGARQANDRIVLTGRGNASAMAEARAAAVRDAMARAPLLAKEAGVALGPLQSSTDNTSQTAAAQNILAQTIALSQGAEQMVTATVTLSWTIKDH